MLPSLAIIPVSKIARMHRKTKMSSGFNLRQHKAGDLVAKINMWTNEHISYPVKITGTRIDELEKKAKELVGAIFNITTRDILIAKEYLGGRYASGLYRYLGFNNLEPHCVHINYLRASSTTYTVTTEVLISRMDFDNLEVAKKMVESRILNSRITKVQRLGMEYTKLQIELRFSVIVSEPTSKPEARVFEVEQPIVDVKHGHYVNKALFNITLAIKELDSAIAYHKSMVESCESKKKLLEESKKQWN